MSATFVPASVSAAVPVVAPPPGLEPLPTPPGFGAPPGLELQDQRSGALHQQYMQVAALSAANLYLAQENSRLQAQENLRIQAQQLAAIHMWNFGDVKSNETSVPKSRESTCAGSTCDDDGTSSTGLELTTLIIRNIPKNISRSMLLQALEDAGFIKEINFVNLPLAYDSFKGFGYAFINFVTGAAAESFMESFSGFSNWPVQSNLAASVDFASGGQGLEAQIERYRNSPAMHESVDDQVKPVLLEDGVRIAFPPPTKLLEAPRLRRRKQ